jgi:hypothetical protein
MAFPTFTASKPTFPISPDGEYVSNVLRTESEAGYVQVRPRTTVQIRTWGVNYKIRSLADYNALLLWSKTAEYATDYWTHPVSNLQFLVRLKGPVVINAVNISLWEASFVLEEVI